LSALRLLAGLGLLASLGCSTAAPGPWQKPGADPRTVERDTFACRTEAQAEALRRYPQGAAAPGLGAAGIIASQQNNDTDRATVEAGQFNDCMAARGYRRG